MNGVFRERRDAIVTGLNSIPGMSCTVPEGAFYAFPNVSGITRDDRHLGAWLLAERRRGVPGRILVRRRRQGLSALLLRRLDRRHRAGRSTSSASACRTTSANAAAIIAYTDRLAEPDDYAFIAALHAAPHARAHFPGVPARERYLEVVADPAYEQRVVLDGDGTPVGFWLLTVHDGWLAELAPHRRAGAAARHRHLRAAADDRARVRRPRRATAPARGGTPTTRRPARSTSATGSCSRAPGATGSAPPTARSRTSAPTACSPAIAASDSIRSAYARRSEVALVAVEAGVAHVAEALVERLGADMSTAVLSVRPTAPVSRASCSARSISARATPPRRADSTTKRSLSSQKRPGGVRVDDQTG